MDAFFQDFIHAQSVTGLRIIRHVQIDIVFFVICACNLRFRVFAPNTASVFPKSLCVHDVVEFGKEK